MVTAADEARLQAQFAGSPVIYDFTVRVRPVAEITEDDWQFSLAHSAADYAVAFDNGKSGETIYLTELGGELFPSGYGGNWVRD